MGRGGTCHRWAPLVWSIVMQEDQRYACIEYGYARHRAEAPTGTKAPLIGSAKTDSSGRTGRMTYTLHARTIDRLQRRKKGMPFARALAQAVGPVGAAGVRQ
jgi:hypothetical protein